MQNAELRREIQGIQQSIANAAEAAPLPARFTVTPLEGQPQVRIVDQETGRSQLVPLFAYRVVREVLSGFFGEVADGKGSCEEES
jgi:hypothetical protein